MVQVLWLELTCIIHELMDICEILDSWLDVQIIDHTGKVIKNGMEYLYGGTNCCIVQTSPTIIYDLDDVSLACTILN